MAPSSRSLKNTKAIIPLPADSTTRRQWSRQTITHADKNTKRSCDRRYVPPRKEKQRKCRMASIQKTRAGVFTRGGAVSAGNGAVRYERTASTRLFLAVAASAGFVSVAPATVINGPFSPIRAEVGGS